MTNSYHVVTLAGASLFDDHASTEAAEPAKAINGRLEAWRRNAVGFRNLTHYRRRSLLHSASPHPLVNALSIRGAR